MSYGIDLNDIDRTLSDLHTVMCEILAELKGLRADMGATFTVEEVAKAAALAVPHVREILEETPDEPIARHP